jgi:rSAM/selenodomain-associated transferase 1
LTRSRDAIELSQHELGRRAEGEVPAQTARVRLPGERLRPWRHAQHRIEQLIDHEKEAGPEREPIGCRHSRRSTAEHADLRGALLLDTLDAVTSVADVEHTIACEPADASERMRALVNPAIDVIAQRGADLGPRMAYVFEDVFRLGVESAVLIGSDLPDLPAGLLREAVAALRRRKDGVVLGPAGDGGYYLIGMNRSRPELFAEIDWSTDRVLAQTLDVLQAENTPVVLLPQWTDVDTTADLHRLIGGTAEQRAPRTRAWVSEHLDVTPPGASG